MSEGRFGWSNRSGGLVHTYVGNNYPGGSTETMTTRRVYMKRVVVPYSGLLASIGAYIKDDGADHVGSLMAAVYEDYSGSPRLLLNYHFSVGTNYLPETAVATTIAHWVHLPIGLYVPAGPYWIAVMGIATNNFLLHYDEGGNDRYYTSGGDWFSDVGWYTVTTGTRRYSIRASVVS